MAFMRKACLAFLLCAALATFAACGKKGDLTLPKAQAAADGAAPTSTPAPAGAEG